MHQASLQIFLTHLKLDLSRILLILHSLPLKLLLLAYEIFNSSDGAEQILLHFFELVAVALGLVMVFLDVGAAFFLVAAELVVELLVLL